MWQQNFYEKLRLAGRLRLRRRRGGSRWGGRSSATPIEPDVTSAGEHGELAGGSRLPELRGKQLLQDRFDAGGAGGAELCACRADGMRLAVVREMHGAPCGDQRLRRIHAASRPAVEVYPLPPLTKKDQAAVKQAEALAPAGHGGAGLTWRLERVPLRMRGGCGCGDSAGGASAPKNPARGGGCGSAGRACDRRRERPGDAPGTEADGGCRAPPRRESRRRCMGRTRRRRAPQ